MESAMALKIGDEAPDFTLQTDLNTSLNLAELKGKSVILYFYPKDSTSGCTVQAQDFRDRAQEFTHLNAVILGVSKDSIKSHCNFKAKENLNFTLLSDPETTVNQLYGVWAEKSMYGKKYFGTDRSTFLIDENGIIAALWRNVKVPGHVDEVLETLKQMKDA